MKLFVPWYGYLVLIMLFFMLSIPRLFLPNYLVGQLEQVIQDQFQPDSLEVEIETRFGWELLGGYFDAVKIQGEGFRYQQLPIDTFSLVSSGLSIDIRDLVRNGQVVYEGSDDLQVVLTVTEAGLNEYFWNHVDPQKNFLIDVQPEGALLAGEIFFLNRRWDLQLFGLFRIRQGTQVLFVPQELAVQETRIPRLLLELISEQYEMVIDFVDLLIPIEVESVELLENQVILRGRA